MNKSLKFQNKLEALPPEKRFSALRDYFLFLLGRREYSAFELLNKVPDFQEEALAVLKELQEQNYQNDERFARHFARYQQQRGQGKLKIQNELKLKGISGDLIQEALNHLDFSDGLEALYRRKFPNPPADEKDRAKRMRFLMGRGFSYGEIAKLLNKKD